MPALATLVLASLLAGTALPQDRIAMPSPTALAGRSAPIRELIVDASRPPDNRLDSAVSRIDAVVGRVAARYGGNSIESVQAATEAGVALIQDWKRYDLARPHLERALALSRTVFGTDHRETAYAIQDVAVVRNELRPELFVQWTEPLAQEALDVRRRVLGRDHLETAGSEHFLASWIYASWSGQRQRNARSPMLPRARDLARHALGVLEGAYGVGHYEVVGTRYLLAEIALAMRDFALVEELSLQLTHRYEAACNPGDGPDAAELLADALRGLSRPAEAEALEAAMDACGGGAGSR